MFSENIRQLRTAYGLSQEAFAAKLGVSVGVITNIELDRLKRPETKMPLFRLISEKFGVPVEWILADDPGPVPLSDQADAQREAQSISKILDSSDPLIAGFLDFYKRRTKQEREQIAQYVLDFAASLKANQK